MVAVHPTLSHLHGLGQQKTSKQRGRRAGSHSQTASGEWRQSASPEVRRGPIPSAEIRRLHECWKKVRVCGYVIITLNNQKRNQPPYNRVPLALKYGNSPSLLSLLVVILDMCSPLNLNVFICNTTYFYDCFGVPEAYWFELLLCGVKYRIPQHLHFCH